VGLKGGLFLHRSRMWIWSLFDLIQIVSFLWFPLILLIALGCFRVFMDLLLVKGTVTSEFSCRIWAFLLVEYGGCDFGSSPTHFMDFVQTNAMVDLGFVGNKFTWSNHRCGNANIQEQLDNGLAN
jgi:hypothetical protein